MNYIIPEGKLWFPPLLYLQLLTLAELLTTLVEPISGLILHGMVLIALIFHGALEQNIHHRRFLLTISLGPLIRLLSLSLPLAGRPLVDWYFGVGALLFVGAIVTTRLIDFDFKRIGFRWGKPLNQIMFGFIGIGLGLLEYIILRPAPLVEEFAIEAIWLPALILAIFTGLLEEMIFRGLIQEASLASYGRFGITYGALLFAILHVGYGSFFDVIFVFAVAMLFGIYVQKTGSIFGVTLAHSWTNITLFLVFPFIIALPPRENVLSPIDTPTPTITVTITDINVPTRTPVKTHTPLVLSPVLNDTEASTPGLTNTKISSTPFEDGDSVTQTPALGCGPGDGWIEYVVQLDDNLFRIGQIFNVTVEELQYGNCLGDSTAVSVGKFIFVPGPATIVFPPTVEDVGPTDLVTSTATLDTAETLTPTVAP